MRAWRTLTRSLLAPEAAAAAAPGADVVADEGTQEADVVASEPEAAATAPKEDSPEPEADYGDTGVQDVDVVKSEAAAMTADATCDDADATCFLCRGAQAEAEGSQFDAAGEGTASDPLGASGEGGDRRLRPLRHSCLTWSVAHPFALLGRKTQGRNTGGLQIRSRHMDLRPFVGTRWRFHVLGLWGSNAGVADVVAEASERRKIRYDPKLAVTADCRCLSDPKASRFHLGLHPRSWEGSSDTVDLRSYFARCFSTMKAALLEVPAATRWSARDSVQHRADW